MEITEFRVRPAGESGGPLVQTSNLWMASWLVFQGFTVAYYLRSSSGVVLAIFNDEEGRTRAAMTEWRTGNPVAPVRAILDIHTEMLMFAKYADQ